MQKSYFIQSIVIDSEGLYPFPLWVNRSNDNSEINALAVNDIKIVHKVVANALKYPDLESIFLGVDFPADARLDMQNDYYILFFYENKEWTAQVFEYANGEVIENGNANEKAANYHLKYLKENLAKLCK